MHTRRSLLKATAGVGLGAACRVATPGVIPARKRRIGMLSTGTALDPYDPAGPFAAFRDGMRAEGFIEGAEYSVDYRFGNGEPDQVLRGAKDLVGLGVEIIVAGTTGATQAALAVTSFVPIVMVASHDPIDAGVVRDLVRPGGNVTGQSLSGAQLWPGQLELLKQLAPVRRLGYLSPYFPPIVRGYPRVVITSVTAMFERSFRAAAAVAGLEVVAPPIASTSDVGSVLATLEAERVDAVHLIESPTWFAQQTRSPINEVVDFAARRRIPSMSGLRHYAEVGLLATYGDARSGVDLYRSVTRYVAKILRGARPGDLSVEVPPVFELSLNAKTASMIGLDLPKHVVDRAAVVFR